MTTDVRFTVLVATKGSNARETWQMRSSRVENERDAVRLVWLRLGLGFGVTGLLAGATALRLPRGISKHARALARRTGADLRVREVVALPLVPLDVHLTRVSAGELDDDNLHAALKGCRDELARQMGIDDRDPVVRWVVHQERGPRKYHAVKVQIVAREMETDSKQEARRYENMAP